MTVLTYANTHPATAVDLVPGDIYIRENDFAFKRDGATHGYRVKGTDTHRRDADKIMIHDSGANFRPMAKDAPVRIWVRGKSLL